MSSFKWVKSTESLELGAAHYDAETPGSLKWRNASRSDRIGFALGLLNDDLVPQTIGLIVGGTIDEYELKVTPKSWTTTIHGRDQMAFTLDYFFKTRYLRAPQRTAVSSLDTPPGITVKVGQFNASQIAEEACAFAGLGLSWEIPDYELQEDFDGVARVIDILRKLIRMFTQVEPFRADILAQNNVVIIRSRNPAMAPDYTYGLSRLKRSEITIRKRASKKIGTVTLLGSRVGDTQTKNQSSSVDIGNVWIEGEQEETKVTEAFGPGASLLSITSTVSTYGMPGHILKHQIKTLFQAVDGGALALSSRDTIDNDWEPVSVDTAGPVSQQVQKSQFVTKEATDPSDGIFKVTQTAATGYDTDSKGFTTGFTTVKKQLNSDSGLLENNAQIVKTMRDIGRLLVEQITEVSSFDSEKQTWVLQSRDTQQQGGYRPGGPGRGLPVKTTTGTKSIGGSTQLSLSQTFSTDPDAVDVVYSDANMSSYLMTVVMAQFAGAQNLIEYEYLFAGVAMPWIRRSMYLLINEILAEDGVTLITVPVMVITEVSTTFDMSKPRSESVQQMRGFGWAPA